MIDFRSQPRAPRKTDAEKRKLAEEKAKAKEEQKRLREESKRKLKEEKEKIAEAKQKQKEEKKKTSNLAKQIKPGECMKVCRTFLISFLQLKSFLILSYPSFFPVRYSAYRYQPHECQIWWFPPDRSGRSEYQTRNTRAASSRNHFLEEKRTFTLDFICSMDYSLVTELFLIVHRSQY